MNVRDVERLARCGIARDKAEGLITAWDSYNVAMLLNDEARSMWYLDYSAADTVDAFFHSLNHKQADLYYRHGLTAHQGSLIEASQQARCNLHAHRPGAAAQFLSAPCPSDYLVNVLRVAKSRREANALLARYQVDARRGGLLGTADGIDRRIATLAALLPPPSPPCNDDCS